MEDDGIQIEGFVSLQNPDENAGENIQQEIVTDLIDGNETVIAVYQVDDTEAQNEETLLSQGHHQIADLSALASVAEFVPTLQEPASFQIENNEDEGSKFENNIDHSNLNSLSQTAGDLYLIEQEQNLDENSVDCIVDGEDSLNEMQSLATPGEYFVTTSYEEMVEIIQDYFERTSSRFVVQKRTKDFGVADASFNLSKHRIQWEDTKNPNLAYEYNFLPFDGVPHITVGRYVMHCQFGTDASAAQKDKRRLMKEKEESSRRTRNLKYPTKKCGCPAKIYVKQVVKFPEYKIIKKTERRKRTGAAKLKEQFNLDRSRIQMEVYFMGRLPVIAEHKFHELMEGREFSKESVHKDLIIKAQELYFKRMSLSEIATALDTYVVNELFYNQEAPDKKRRKYNPSRKDLRNFIGRIRQLERFTQEEKDKIQEMVNTIQNEQKNFNIFFTSEEDKLLNTMLQGDSSDEEYYNSEEIKVTATATVQTQKKRFLDRQEIQTFLFCYQTPEQQRLLKRYGCNTFLVEINHNSSVKRALTFKMFVLLVQTNVDYQIVGCMVFSKQRKDGLKDGLTMFKDWNGSWFPKYFLIDCIEEVSTAYNQIFPNTPFFLNIHSCERQWLEFLSTPSNELRDSDEEIMTFLKNMAYSYSENSLSLAASLLEESSVWHNSVKLRTWFQSEWLPTAKKWVAGYRPEDLFVFDHLKHDLPSCIKVFEDLLSDSTKLYSGFIGMFEALHQVTAKEDYAKYIERNRNQVELGRQFRPDETIADGLAGIPLFITPHIYATCKEASTCNFSIAEGNQLGIFTVNTLGAHGVNEVIEMVIPNDGQTSNIEVNCQGQQQVIIDPNASLESCLLQAMNFVAAGNATVDLQPQPTDISFVSEAVPTVVPAEVPKLALNGTTEHLMQTDQLEDGENTPCIESEAVNNAEEYTVSYGDMSSYPFCTCPHWQQYKMPCVHMFSIFQNIPGWNYDMLSPVYRMNNVFHEDHSCISSQLQFKSQTLKEKGCQTNKISPTMVAVQTQKNISSSIFLPMNTLKVSENLFSQVTDLLFHLNKCAFLFKDVIIYKKLRGQLTDIARGVHQRLIKKQIEDQLDGKVASAGSKITINPLLLPKALVVNPVVVASDGSKVARRSLVTPSTLVKKVKVAVQEPHTSASEFPLVNLVNIEEINNLLKAFVEPKSSIEAIPLSKPPNNRNTETEQEICPGAAAAPLEIEPQIFAAPVKDDIQSSCVDEEQSMEVNETIEISIEGVDSKTEDVILAIAPEKGLLHVGNTEKLTTLLKPIIRPGMKRDASHLLTEYTASGDKTKGFNKVSILEYLPLLKQKCVKPKDQEKEMKISEDLLTEKLNGSPTKPTIPTPVTSSTVFMVKSESMQKSSCKEVATTKTNNELLVCKEGDD